MLLLFIKLYDGLKIRSSNLTFSISVFNLYNFQSNIFLLAILKGGDKALKELKKKDKEKRNKLVLWKQPLKTIHYFLSECKVRFIEYVNK